MLSLVESLGIRTLRAINALGKMMIFLGAALASAVVPPFRARHVLRQIHFIGVKSLFVIVLTASFTARGSDTRSPMKKWMTVPPVYLVCSSSCRVSASNGSSVKPTGSCELFV